MIARLNHDATTESDVRQYFITRALQLSPHGIRWDGNMESPFPGAYIVTLTDINRNESYNSFYILVQYRNNGLGHKVLNACSYPIITIVDCRIEDFLEYSKVSYRIVQGVFDTSEYRLIQTLYGNRRAKRSGVLLMNHIDEGLFILERIGATEEAKRAFCLHPVIQNDTDLVDNLEVVLDCVQHSNPRILPLALEYRSTANAWLSDKVQLIDSGLLPGFEYDNPRLSPLSEVNDMLIADKVQNYKDFIIHHRGKHDRSVELDKYFQVLLSVLGVTDFDQFFQNLISLDPTGVA